MIPFIKMHGCGNDYVFLDGFTNEIPAVPETLSIKLSDRRFGIGADGLVLMLPDTAPGVAGRMRMFNADGSEGSLCGNALRCMAMWLHQSGRCGNDFAIAMGDRVVEVHIVESDTNRQTALVSILIGCPHVQNSNTVGRKSFIREIELSGVHVPGLMSPIVHVSMGNPHTILFVRSLEEVRFTELGPMIEHHSAFPDRTNVEFVEIIHKDKSRPAANVRVWERGSGETLACGSGACAVAVAGIGNGLLSEAEPATISMRGGDLEITWDQNQQVHLKGPAVESFRGTFRH